jgi:hypothetical protein
MLAVIPIQLEDIYSMPVNLLKGPSPALTHTERKAKFRQ